MEARPAVTRACVSLTAAAGAMTWALGGLLALLALLFAARRVSGGLVEPLPGGTLLLAGGLAALLAATTRAMGRLAGLTARGRSTAMALRWGPTLALVVGSAALIVPGTSPLALVALTLLLLGEELWSTEALGDRPLQEAARQANWSAPTRSNPGDTERDWAREAPLEPHDQIAAGDEKTLLRMTRSRTDAGQEVLHGVLRVEFATRQRAEAAHLAFCPPFAATPTFEAQVIEGPAAQVRVTQLLPYGGRLDLRLDQPHAEAVELLVQFTAHAPPLK